MEKRRELEIRLQDNDEEVRLQALKGLAALGIGDSLPALYQALGDSGWRVRKEGVEIFLGLPAAASLCGEICELLHSQENAGLRNAAVEILIRVGRAALPVLLEELACQDHDVRKFALDILGEIGDTSAAEAMLGALADADDNVRAAAAENLGKLRFAEAVPALLDALDGADLLLRFTILEALGQIGATVPVDRLLPLGSDRMVRKALFDCLGQVGGLEALPELVAGLTDEMRNVREAAATALTCVARGEESAFWSRLRELAGPAQADALMEMLDSTSEAVRKAAMTLLGACGEARHARHLLNYFADVTLGEVAVASLVMLGRHVGSSLTELWAGADGRSRICLAYVIGASGCLSGSGLLIEGLGSDNLELRLMSARALGELGEAVAFSPLLAALQEPSEELRREATQALSRLAATTATEAVGMLEPLATAADPGLRAAAIRILACCDAPGVGGMLRFALKDEAAEVRRAAVRAIEARPGEEQITSLMLALTDEDGDVRRLAAEALGASGGKGGVGALELALRDEDIWVRAAAVRSLGRIGGADALHLIDGALADPIGLVAIAALETLGQHDPDRLKTRALIALEHDDEEVVNAAIQFLSGGGSSDWLEERGTDLINHRHWEVRLNAARALAALLGPRCVDQLETRLLVEGEDLVRQELQDLLLDLRSLSR